MQSIQALTLKEIGVADLMAAAKGYVRPEGWRLVVDLPESSTEALWVTEQVDCLGPWFKLPTASIKSITVLGPSCGELLRVKVVVKLRDEFGSLECSLGHIAPDRQAVQVVEQRGALSGPEWPKTWTWQWITRGDCHMDAGANLTLRPDGSGTFLAQVRSDDSGDNFRVQFIVENIHRGHLFTTPVWERRCNDDGTWTGWRIDFGFPQAHLASAYWITIPWINCSG